MKKLNKILIVVSIPLTVFAGLVIIAVSILEHITSVSLIPFTGKIAIGLCFIAFAVIMKICDDYEKIIEELLSAKGVTETEEYDLLECDERDCLNNQTGYCSLLEPEFDDDSCCISAKVGDE